MGRPRRTTAYLLLVAICCLTASGVASQASATYQVIVHPDNRIGEVSKEFLQNAFLKKAVAWGDGETVLPVDLSKKFPVRAEFGRDVLKKTPVQLRRYWNQLIFSGKGTPPPEMSSEAAVIAYVLAHRGAVGYLPADSPPGRARVVRVR